MPWYMIVFLICIIIAPFDALYLYIKAERRRDKLRRGKGEGDQGDGKEER